MSFCCRFANVELTLPEGWVDYSDNLPEGSPPTLSRGEEAIGALQFTTARYKSGVKPRFDRQLIQSLLRDFEQSRDFPMAEVLEEFVNVNRKTFGVFSDYQLPEEFIRIWYVSDGDNLAFVTLVTIKVDFYILEPELREAHDIVQSIAF